MAVETTHGYRNNRTYIRNMKKFSMKQMVWDKMVVKTIRGILKLFGLKK